MSMSREDLRALIQGASAPPPHAVEVPGLGSVFVRVMTPFDSDATRRQLEQHGKGADGQPLEDGCAVGRLLASVLCDEAGAPLFEIGNAADVQMLSKLPGPVNNAIFKAHRVANGIAADEGEASALGKA